MGPLLLSAALLLVSHQTITPFVERMTAKLHADHTPERMNKHPNSAALRGNLTNEMPSAFLWTPNVSPIPKNDPSSNTAKSHG